AGDHIDTAFEQSRCSRKRLFEQLHHRHRAKLFNIGFTRDAIEQVRHNAEIDARTASAFDHRIEQQLRVNVGIGNQHFANVVKTNEAVHLVIAPQRRPSAQILAFWLRAIRRNKPDDAAPQFRIVSNFVDAHFSHAIRAHDENRNYIDMPAAIESLQTPQRNPITDECDDPQRIIIDEDQPEIRKVGVDVSGAVEKRQYCDQQGTDRDGLEDAYQIFGEGKLAADAVQAVIPESRNLNQWDEIKNTQVRAKLRMNAREQRQQSITLLD